MSPARRSTSTTSSTAPSGRRPTSREPGAPASSFDAIYAFADQRSVAEAAPGDRDFNGGRWQVHSIAVDDYAAALEAGDLDGNGVLDAVDEVQAAIDSGHAWDTGIVREFVCTVNKLPAGQR